jgi:hypothetical protein
VPFGENGAVDSQRGRADEAGEQMHSELDAIQERLRVLKRRLDAREAVIEVDDKDSVVIAAPPRHDSGA